MLENRADVSRLSIATVDQRWFNGRFLRTVTGIRRPVERGYHFATRRLASSILVVERLRENAR